MSCLIFPTLCLCSFWMNIEENSISLLQNPFFLGRREHREQDLNISRNLLWHKSSIFPFLFGFFVCSCGRKSWRIDLEMFVLIVKECIFPRALELFLIWCSMVVFGNLGGEKIRIILDTTPGFSCSWLGHVLTSHFLESCNDFCWKRP